MSPAIKAFAMKLVPKEGKPVKLGQRLPDRATAEAVMRRIETELIESL